MDICIYNTFIIIIGRYKFRYYIIIGISNTYNKYKYNVLYHNFHAKQKILKGEKNRYDNGINYIENNYLNLLKEKYQIIRDFRSHLSVITSHHASVTVENNQDVAVFWLLEERQNK